MIASHQDLLVSDISLIYTTPFSTELGVILFQEFCSSRPGDPFYGVNINSLPLSLSMRTALASAVVTSGTFNLCGG